jgi:hypothetical protein
VNKPLNHYKHHGMLCSSCEGPNPRRLLLLQLGYHKYPTPPPPYCSQLRTNSCSLCDLTNISIPEYRFRNLETQLQEGASGRRGASGSVLPEARGFRAGGFSGPSETPYCRKPPAGSGGASVCGSEAPASRTPETPLRKLIQISVIAVQSAGFEFCCHQGFLR